MTKSLFSWALVPALLFLFLSTTTVASHHHNGIALLLFPAMLAASQSQSAHPPLNLRNIDLVTGSEWLAMALNDYRESSGLTRVRWSRGMMAVAQRHVQNQVNQRLAGGESCSAHSWIDTPKAFEDGLTTCCYTPNHAQAECMWKKPEQVTRDWEFPLDGYFGFDIATFRDTVEDAVTSWQFSPAHNNVILSQGNFASFLWTGLGCASRYPLFYTSGPTTVNHCWFTNGGMDQNPYDVRDEEMGNLLFSFYYIVELIKSEENIEQAQRDLLLQRASPVLNSIGTTKYERRLKKFRKKLRKFMKQWRMTAEAEELPWDGDYWWDLAGTLLLDARERKQQDEQKRI